MGSEGQHTQKGACLGLSSEFTFPLGVGGHRRAADRLAELRDGSIESLALGHPFDPNPGVFQDGKRDISRISLGFGIEKTRGLSLSFLRSISHEAGPIFPSRIVAELEILGLELMLRLGQRGTGMDNGSDSLGVPYRSPIVSPTAHGKPGWIKSYLERNLQSLQSPGMYLRTSIIQSATLRAHVGGSGFACAFVVVRDRPDWKRLHLGIGLP